MAVGMSRATRTHAYTSPLRSEVKACHPGAGSPAPHPTPYGSGSSAIPASTFSAAITAIPSRAWTVALPTCGRITQFGSSSRGESVGKRLGRGHVQPGREDRAAEQGRVERPLIDHLPAGGVDQHGRPLHPQQGLPVDQVAGGVRQRAVQGDEVAGFQQFGQLDPAGAEVAVRVRLGGVRGVEHLHPPPAAAAVGEGPADPAEPDHAHRLAGEFLSEVVQRGPGLPVALADAPGRRGETAGGGEHQQDGGVRGGGRQHVRRVADGHAAVPAGGHVDVVVAHRVVRHDLQPVAGRPQHGFVNPVGQHRHQPGGTRGPCPAGGPAAAAAASARPSRRTARAAGRARPPGCGG